MASIKKPLIIANWKMNPATEKDAVVLFRAVKKGLPRNKKFELAIASPAVFLPVLKREKGIMLAAQDMSPEDAGAFTGQISGKMLRDAGAKYIILGHSEARAVGETSSEVSRKVLLALKLGIIPIVCVGERMRDESGQFYTDLKEQLRESVAGVSKSGLSKVIIAYEPIWAISTTESRKDITKEEAIEMILFIRKTMSTISGSNKLIGTKVLYGGSVNDRNIEMFLEIKAEGFLVGGASLDPKKFIKVINTITKK